MTQVLHSDTTTSAIEIISSNMLQQIIALQQVINSREPQQRFPTTQEIGLLSKMISGLEKLKRFLVPPKSAGTVNAEQRTRSKKLAGISKQNDETEPAFSDHKEIVAGNEHWQGTYVPSVVEATQASPSAPEAAHFPILEHEFEEYRHLFDDTRLRKARTMYVKGKEYRTNWLQYNLYQYCLPPQERRFCFDEANYHREIDHEKTSLLITKYLKQQQMG